MKIGIDARFLTHPQLGGFKTYTENLVRALSKVDSENQYLLYLDRPPSDRVLPDAENFSYRVVPFSIPRFGMPYREQVALRRQIAKDKPDIIHFLSNTATVRLKKKFIITLHDTIQVSNPYKLDFPWRLSNNKIWAITIYSKWAILRTARKANSIITVSNFEKDQIIRDLNISPDRIFVTHLAPNPVFKPASEESKKAWRKYAAEEIGIKNRFILGIGHEPRKRIPQLIKAFSQIAHRHPGLDLVLVAAQEEKRTYFLKLSAQSAIEKRVHVLGSLQPSDLVVLYNLAEVFVFPSERESFGLPPLEALACGVPTIAMNMTSLPEVLEDGAILLDGKNVQTWANAIERVLTDDELRSDLVCRGLKQAAKLTWQRCALETLQIYREVLVEGPTISKG